MTLDGQVVALYGLALTLKQNNSLGYLRVYGVGVDVTIILAKILVVYKCANGIQWVGVKVYIGQLMRLWYLSHRRTAKAQASLRIRAVSPEPSLSAHMKYRSRRKV